MQIIGVVHINEIYCTFSILESTTFSWSDWSPAMTMCGNEDTLARSRLHMDPECQKTCYERFSEHRDTKYDSKLIIVMYGHVPVCTCACACACVHACVRVCACVCARVYGRLFATFSSPLYRTLDTVHKQNQSYVK